MIEAKDVENFKTFVRGICSWAPPNGYCLRFITGCRSCLQRNGKTIVDPNIAIQFQSPLSTETPK